MTRENKLLAVVAAVLAAANLGFYFSGSSGGNLSFDEEKFAIADTSEVSSVIISGDDQRIELERTAEGWKVNDQHLVDRRLRNILFSVLQRVRIRKPATIPDTVGLYVEVRGNESLSFRVSSNPTKTKTYFYDPEEELGYEVEIPGYNDYIGAVFELKKDQWRDRVMLNESSRTIQRLTLEYTETPSQNVALFFDQNFYQVEGISAFDTTFLFDYLDQFRRFEVNERISAGDFPRYDSLSKTSPLAIMEIETINKPEPLLFNVYPSLPGEAFHLVQDQSGEFMIVDQKRIRQLLAKSSDFNVKPSEQ